MYADPARGSAGEPAQAPREGGSITFGIEAETGSGWCLPRAQLAISGITVASAIYDTLTVPNDRGEYVPYLAESVAHDPAYTQWTVRLRDGVRFHDGTPLDADAVKLNLDAQRRGPLLGFFLADVDDVSVVDRLTVRITTSRPWVAFDAFLYLDGRAGIAAPAQLDDPDRCATTPIGTGPFRFVGGGHWNLNDEMVLVRNPDYWRKDSAGRRLPYLDRLTFVPIPEEAQRTNGLESRRLDVLHTSNALQLSALRSLGADTAKLLVQNAGRRQVRYYLLNTARPPFDDLYARRAFALAIDRRQINQIRNGGILDRADGPFDEAVPGRVPNLRLPDHDLKRARVLVERYKAAHRGEFEIVLDASNDPDDVAEAQLVKEQLARVGIDAGIQVEDQTARINTALAGNFDALLWRNHYGGDPDTQYPWWSRGSPVNFGRIDDPVLQALLDEARGTSDGARREQLYQKVTRRFASKLYDVWAWYVDWTVASRPAVHGLSGIGLPDGRGRPAFIGVPSLVGVWIDR